jgi:hypothetical protein
LENLKNLELGVSIIDFPLPSKGLLGTCPAVNLGSEKIVWGLSTPYAVAIRLPLEWLAIYAASAGGGNTIAMIVQMLVKATN